MRRTLIIIAIVVVLAGAGAAAYFYFFANKASLVVAPAGSVGLPTSGGITPVPGGAGTTTLSTASPVGTGPARLVKISAGPVALGAVVVNKPAMASSSADVTASYIERQSGNVYAYSITAGTNTRTSNRTVPGIQSALWLPDGSVAFVQYLSGADYATVNSYALPADGATQGFFLPQNLSDISVSSTSVLTLSSGVNGSIASLSRADGTRLSELFTTPLSSLRVSFAGKGQYLAYTKPSARILGSAFLIDSAGRFSKVAGPRSGLVAKASPSGKWILASSMSGEAMQMHLINTGTGESLPLPVATIADKCVWTADDSAVYCGVPISPPPGFNYPDDWYQGAVSLHDRIWKIDVGGRYAQFVLDFSKEDKGALDAQALAIDPLKTTLVFINKNDGSLWSYSL